MYIARSWHAPHAPPCRHPHHRHPTPPHPTAHPPRPRTLSTPPCALAPHPATHLALEHGLGVAARCDGLGQARVVLALRVVGGRREVGRGSRVGWRPAAGAECEAESAPGRPTGLRGSGGGAGTGGQRPAGRPLARGAGPGAPQARLRSRAVPSGAAPGSWGRARPPACPPSGGRPAWAGSSRSWRGSGGGCLPRRVQLAGWRSGGKREGGGRRQRAGSGRRAAGRRRAYDHAAHPLDADCCQEQPEQGRLQG